MNSPSRGVSQCTPMPGVVCTRSSPFGRSRLSVSFARAASSFMKTSCAVWWSSSPCSVRMSPRACRWNSDTPSSCSSAETCRDTADCDSPSCSPAWVKLPASAAAWKTLSLSQSMLVCAFIGRSLRRDRQLGLALGGEETFRLERCHAALARGGDRLAINVIGDVAGGKHAWHRCCRRKRRGLDVARALHLHLSHAQLGCRRMADRDEHAVRVPFGCGAGFDVAENDAFHLERVLAAQDLLQHRIPDDCNFRIPKQPVLEDV